MILIFDSVHHVMAAEKRLMARGIAYALVPTPKEVSAECGISVEIRPTDEAAVATALSGMRFKMIANVS